MGDTGINTNIEALGTLLQDLKGAIDLLGSLEQLMHKAPAGKAGGSTKTGPSAPTPASSKKPGAFAGPDGFLWKPISDSDRKLVVLLPPNLKTKATGVKILSPDGSQVLATGIPKGAGNGDRLHFRFTRQGNSFPAGCIAEITMRDGSKKQIRIEKPEVRTEGRGR